MPWTHKGMSLRYDQWAEMRWEKIQDRECLLNAWEYGLALCARAYLQDIDIEWRGKSVEDAADFMLETFFAE